MYSVMFPAALRIVYALDTSNLIPIFLDKGQETKDDKKQGLTEIQHLLYQYNPANLVNRILDNFVSGLLRAGDGVSGRAGERTTVIGDR